MDPALLTIAVLSAAFVLDYIIGDPRRLPHPVRLSGAVIDYMEKMVRKFFTTPCGLKVGGALIVFITAAGAVVVTILLLAAAYRLHLAAGLALEIYIIFTTLAGGDLRNHVARVKRDLQSGEIEKARASAALLVSRDTSFLDESGISRAALESLFENSADGLVAPFLFAAVGGPAAAVLYKTVNTLDSMLGYKNKEYQNIGYFAAKTDDVFSYIPARLTALYIILAAAGRGRWRQGLRVLASDRHKHQSPNSAWPEAAAAGVLGVGFGGVDYYRGEIIERPQINESGKKPLSVDIGRGLALFRIISLLAFISLICLSYWLRIWEALSF